MKKIILLAITVCATTFSFSQNNSKDEQDIRSILSTLEKGWNNKSGKDFSSVFADIHDYIVINGMYFSNFTRNGNAAAHQSLFDGVYKNRNLKVVADKVAFIRPDLAMVHAFGGLYEVGKSQPENPGGIMTLLVEKQKGDWEIISFHNHELNTEELKQRSPMPLNVMYAKWYGKNNQDK